MNNRIYFDYAATTPCDPQVIRAMEPFYFKNFANPSSSHSFGQEAAKAIEDARQSFAQNLGADPKEIIFNSGATEGNNHAITGLARSKQDEGNHIIISGIEHHSVHDSAQALEKEGFDISYLKVDQHGLIDPLDLRKSIKEKTILVCVIQANNEIGTVQSVSELSKITKEKNILLLIDAVQAVGHIPVNVNKLGADCLTVSAHKFYGPKGVGALYIRKGVNVGKFLKGGSQEFNIRASTQNVAGIVGLAKAMEICKDKMEEEISQQTSMRERILNEVPEMIDGVKVNGERKQRLPNNAHFSFEKIKSEDLLVALDMEGFASSMGSTCTTGTFEPSHVLKAIGLSDELALGALRLTIGRWSSNEDIDAFLNKLPKIIKKLRK